MDDRKLANLLTEKTRRMGAVCVGDQLPDIAGSYPTVSFPRERMASFRDSYTRLMVFAAHVCRVEIEDLSTLDMYKFLMERADRKDRDARESAERLRESARWLVREFTALNLIDGDDLPGRNQ